MTRIIPSHRDEVSWLKLPSRAMLQLATMRIDLISYLAFNNRGIAPIGRREMLRHSRLCCLFCILSVLQRQSEITSRSRSENSTTYQHYNLMTLSFRTDLMPPWITENSYEELASVRGATKDSSGNISP